MEMDAKPTLHELRAALLAAREAERQAADERLAIEAAIVSLMPAKDEGTVTDKDSGISVTYRLTRSVDTDALRQDWAALPAPVQDAFRWKAEVDARKAKAIADVSPADYAALARYVTIKPAKPSITIKEST